MNMNAPAFSFLVLTFNDEMHVGRLFDSIKGLNAASYVLDSGSTDRTIEICSEYGAEVKQHPFENHPKQWDQALGSFKINTPWVIALDSDQMVSAELFALLRHFDDAQMAAIDGIYFNRRNIYKGKWIRYGGYYPFYMLKMFRIDKGYSDLNENMDHRFIVPGKTCIWKKGYLIEENQKEASIQFWLDKHGRYSDLLAEEEVERMMNLRSQAVTPKVFGTPNERKAYFKMLWWQLPRYLRPALYFGYRMIIQMGFLDGRSGIIFHFLQGFWFRLIVDIKIEEILQTKSKLETKQACQSLDNSSNMIFRFGSKFLMLFIAFYGFNILFIGITAPGKIYLPWLAENLNYIQAWRRFDLQSTAAILHSLGYHTTKNGFTLAVAGHAGFKLVYSCLGYGLMSFYAAFVIAWPKTLFQRATMLICGLAAIQLLNLIRFLCISLYWKPGFKDFWLDHHTMFNITIYVGILAALYWWTSINKKLTKETYGTHNLNKEF
jgi:exosortase/archaeosortase family protein